MHDAALRRDGGIEAHHLDAALHGLLADRHQRIGIVCRDDDAIDLLRDLRVDHRDLLLSRGLGGRGVDDLDAAELGRSFLRAIGAGVEIAVPEVLDDQRDALVRLRLGAARNDAPAPRAGRRRLAPSCSTLYVCKLHGKFPPCHPVSLTSRPAFAGRTARRTPGGCNSSPNSAPRPAAATLPRQRRLRPSQLCRRSLSKIPALITGVTRPKSTQDEASVGFRLARGFLPGVAAQLFGTGT